MGFSSFLFPGFLLSGGNCNDSASGSFLCVCFLIGLLWFCLIYAATDVCSWDFVVSEFNRDGVMWFLILFCSIMLFLNSSYFGVHSS